MTYSGDLRRYCLFINTILVIESLTLIIRGIQISKLLQQWSPVLGADYEVSSTAAITIGALLLVSTVFGYMGICANGYGMVIIYTVITFLFSFIMLVYGISLWIDIQGVSRTREQLQKKLEVLPPYHLYDIERELQCCGVDHFEDYYSVEEDLEPAWEESNQVLVKYPDNILVNLERTNRTSNISTTPVKMIRVFNTTSDIRQSTTKYLKKWFSPKVTSPRLHVFMMFKNDPFSTKAKSRPTEKTNRRTTFEDIEIIRMNDDLDDLETAESSPEIAEWPVHYQNEETKAVVYNWEYRITHQVCQQKEITWIELWKLYLPTT